MKNFIRGTVLGLAVGASVVWYQGMPNYFPALVAAVILIGILIPLESQEKRLIQLLRMVEEVRDRLDEPHFPPAPETHGTRHPRETEQAFIPTIQSDTLHQNPSSQKKRTVDRSLEDVAKKLSSIQGVGHR